MAIRRRLFQNHRYHLIGVLVVILTGCIYANTIESQSMLTPETSPNARLATQRLSLDTLSPSETPLVPLKLSDAQLTSSLPGLDVSRNTVTTVGGWETLELRFTRNGEPAGSASIVRVTPIDALKRTISLDFALFTGPINHLTAHRDPTLDLLATFAGSDAYAWAVRGSFYTKVRGFDAKNTAKTVTDLLFEGQ